MSLNVVSETRRPTPKKGRAGKTRAHMAFPFPPPSKGLDVTEPLPGGDPLTALRLENMIPRAKGPTLRAGYSRWCSLMAGQVRSLMDYRGATPAEAGKFAASTDGNVYDVTNALDSVTTPPIAFTSLTGNIPGEYSWINFTTSAGVHYLVVVGQGAGMWVYDGFAWTQIAAGMGPMEIDGVDPADFDYVMIWKGRLWFIQADTTVAWYLDVGVIAGEATAFDFGSLLPHGGSLAALSNWTVDGGNGIDDNLVIVSTEGDVLLYSGIDPDEASTFQLIGQWFLGRVPAGRRFITLYLQDLAILSERGLCFLSELLRGEGFFSNSQIAQNINTELATAVSAALGERYWELRFLPHEQIIVVNTPQTASGNFQWVYEVNQKAFCTLRGYFALTMDNLAGRSYFGDSDGNMWLAFEGNSDGEIDGEPGTDLQGTVVTAFQVLGDGVQIKQFLMVRPSFIALTAPGFLAQLNPDWIFALPQGVPTYLGLGDSLWNEALWNEAVWSGEDNTYQAWVGAVGIGRYGSLALKVRGHADTVFVAWSALVQPGGIL